MKIQAQDIRDRKERCPNDGNRILLHYGTGNDGLPSSLRCTHCMNDFELNEQRTEYDEVEFYKNKVNNFSEITGKYPNV